MKKYILIAGVNGAGKSTLYQTLTALADMPRINTDEIVRSFGDWRNASDVVKAGKIAVKRINEYLTKGITFNQETTLCGTSIIQNINKAKSLGYCIELHYVSVDTVEIAKERIAYRVSQGGHGIPDVDVERRYIESYKQLKEILGICDMAILYDNTDVFKRFAVFKDGELCNLADDSPRWFTLLEL
ncbi:MAG: zeta toxin family protein [Lachnospiraceae bacterium]|nr:zeta toxin family protein [Lachnospiraceae bacterium]